MVLALYLDDCADDNVLATLLRRAGYVVQTPRFAGTTGDLDPEHLDYAARNNYTLLTKDPADFLQLHNESQNMRRSHSGLLLVYEEKDVSKNMSRTEIVAAIQNLLNAAVPIENQVHILNHWR